MAASKRRSDTTPTRVKEKEEVEQNPASPKMFISSRYATSTLLAQEDIGSDTRKISASYKHIPSQFSLSIWIKQRPFVGSLLLIMAGALVMWGPLALFQFAFLPGSTIWAGLLVGGAMCVLGLIQLFAPSHALVTGALGIVFSLASLMAALGGFGIGMILGIIGGAQGVAWKNIVMSRADYQRLCDERSQRRQSGRWKNRVKRFIFISKG